MGGPLLVTRNGEQCSRADRAVSSLSTSPRSRCAKQQELNTCCGILAFALGIVVMFSFSSSVDTCLQEVLLQKTPKTTRLPQHIEASTSVLFASSRS